MRRLGVIAFLIVVASCSAGSGGGSDAPPSVPRADAAPAAPPDARIEPPDALAPPSDGAPPMLDGPEVADARPPAPDAPAVTPDAPPSPPDAAVDPCQGIPPTGACATASSLVFCVIPEGGDPHLAAQSCSAAEVCQMVDGGARCVPTGACSDGAIECLGTTQIRVCVAGSWQISTCTGQCLSTPLGDVCGLDAPTQLFTANLQYEFRGPNNTLSDWGPIFLATAPGFVILSVRVLADGTILPIDATVTGEGNSPGSFAVKVPLAPQAGDKILAVATQLDANHQFAVALLDPNLTPSLTPYTPGTPPQPHLWFWSWATRGLSSGTQLTIPETAGSGAARVFDYMRYIFESTAARWPGRSRPRFIVWLGGGVSWTCGSCFAHQIGFEFGTWFGGQVWLNGGPDQEYWADSVTAHELGHWAMASYGHEVGEGGPHFFGQPASPGLAWSEGWATWFSSDARQDPIYFDKQHGTSFWVDISDRSASDSPWPRPAASLGLYQPIYENEISAMMWSLSATQGLTSAPLDAALASPRMTVPPFLRGYTTPAGINTTFFGDFLDALDCAGLGPAAIDAATDPFVHYPYPSLGPVCPSQAPAPPATLHMELVDGAPLPGAHVHLRAVLTRDPTWSFPVSLTFQTPAGADVANVAGLSGVTVDQSDLELDLSDVPASDVIAVAISRSTRAGFHAEARYRFGRPEPLGRIPVRRGPRLHLGNMDLGEPIPGEVR